MYYDAARVVSTLLQNGLISPFRNFTKPTKYDNIKLQYPAGILKGNALVPVKYPTIAKR